MTRLCHCITGSRTYTHDRGARCGAADSLISTPQGHGWPPIRSAAKFFVSHVLPKMPVYAAPRQVSGQALTSACPEIYFAAEKAAEKRQKLLEE